jgi:hypothetical protein
MEYPYFPHSAYQDSKGGILFKRLLGQDVCSHQWNSLARAMLCFEKIQKTMQERSMDLSQHRLHVPKEQFLEYLDSLTAGTYALYISATWTDLSVDSIKCMVCSSGVELGFEEQSLQLDLLDGYPYYSNDDHNLRQATGLDTIVERHSPAQPSLCSLCGTEEIWEYLHTIAYLLDAYCCKSE